MKSWGVAIFWFLSIAFADTAFCADEQGLPQKGLQSNKGLESTPPTGLLDNRPDRPCCKVIEIQENGMMTMKEIETGRIFNVQIDDTAQMQRLRVGQPLYVDFDTGKVSLNGTETEGTSPHSYEDMHTNSFIDLYVGSTSTQKADVQGSSFIGNAVANDVKFDSSLVGGMRVGGWLPPLPYLGFAVDGFYFTTNIKPQTLTGCIGSSCGALSTTAETEQEHIAIAFDVMLRLPLATSKQFPTGRFQPYITVGPALFISTWREPGFTSRTTTLGFKGGAGGKFFLTKNVALFGEYRLTSFEPEHDFRFNNVTFDVSNRLTTHHFLGGLGVHF
jgi:opacity protein-like surface antigen